MNTLTPPLLKDMESLSKHNQEWYKAHLRFLLESDKPHYEKADLIAKMLQELELKIAYVASTIKELQAIKVKLSDAKTIALEATASVLAEYGIDRLDGVTVSSITITPQKIKTKESIEVLDDIALINLGFYKPVVDMHAVKEAMSTIESMNTIDPYIRIETKEETTPARIKINAKRTNTTTQADKLEEVVKAA